MIYVLYIAGQFISFSYSSALTIMAYVNDKPRSIRILENTAKNGRGLEKLIAKRRLAEIALNKANFAIMMYEANLDTVKWQEQAVDNGDLPF